MTYLCSTISLTYMMKILGDEDICKSFLLKLG